MNKTNVQSANNAGTQSIREDFLIDCLPMHESQIKRRKQMLARRDEILLGMIRA